MKHVGNAANAKLNGEWGKHVRGKYKRFTSKLRRLRDKELVKKLLLE